MARRQWRYAVQSGSGARVHSDGPPATCLTPETWIGTRLVEELERQSRSEAKVLQIIITWFLVFQLPDSSRHNICCDLLRRVHAFGFSNRCQRKSSGLRFLHHHSKFELDAFFAVKKIARFSCSCLTRFASSSDFLRSVVAYSLTELFHCILNALCPKHIIFPEQEKEREKRKRFHYNLNINFPATYL